ncbi:cell division protein ZapE [Candidatus Pelagibacter communis]|uniref:cell division protein ZapE n=1 Tax=Pelagibacter ubique TaxID=198252 RepID=UPI00094D4102|nr:cell division protein ZapE [Candidatus Pelagibacter ubique]
MFKNSLQNSFIEFCHSNKFEINNKQIEIVNSLEDFLNTKKKLLNFFTQTDKYCFYLYGGVGVGKTMIVNQVYQQVKANKMKVHFNEFMINFHDFRHEENEENSIKKFVKNLKKKFDLIFLDEFQVTNIVDAMILGKLFEKIFEENIKIILTTNTKITDLYKDGLQREQFIPFLELINKKSVQKELFLEDDYRTQRQDKYQRIFYPLNEKTLFNVNQKFRILTKNLKKEKKSINTKGRVFNLNNFYDGVARFNFRELCDKNLGAEDYLNLSRICNHIFIEEVPIFNDYNSNQQLRFITLIDIFYEKKVGLTISMETEIMRLGTSKKHAEVFKRTISRVYEMTASNNLLV